MYVLYAVRDAAEENVDGDLHARFSVIRQYFPQDLNVVETTRLRNTLEEHVATGAGVWPRVADKQGHWLYRSEAIKTLEDGPPFPESLPRKGAASVNSARLGRSAASRALMDEFDEMLQTLRWSLAVASPLLLLLACAGGYWMGGKALQPVDEIAVTVRRIGSQTLAERLSPRGTGDELDRLSATINEMLMRLEFSFKLVTQFTADASHELRMPVAIIRTTGEVIKSCRRTPEEHEIAWEQVVVQTERMSNLIEDLLFLARAPAGQSGILLESMDLGDSLRSVASEMRVLTDASGLGFTVSSPLWKGIRRPSAEMVDC